MSKLSDAVATVLEAGYQVTMPVVGVPNGAYDGPDKITFYMPVSNEVRMRNGVHLGPSDPAPGAEGREGG